MGKQLYTIYDKKSYIEHMTNALPDDAIIVTTNVLDGAEVQKKKGSIKVSQLHAKEFFEDSNNVKFLVEGKAIPISTLICKKEVISNKYITQLEKDNGMTGFSIENPY